MSLSLPSRPHLDQLRKQAKDLLAAWGAGDAEALAALREHHPEKTLAAGELRLSDAQLVTARRYGFPSWPRLKSEVELASMAFEERARRFVQAAVDESPGPIDGAFRLAQRLLARDPALAKASVWSALVLGDVEAVRRAIERDPEWARRKGGPAADREPLHYVAYSKFHRESPQIAEGLLAVARLLLDHGADPNAVFIAGPWPLRALLGACGVTNFPAMAELLLDRGAMINDGESLYHSTEHADTQCLELLIARGADPKGTNALFHALDVKGLERARLLLEAGADPNEVLGGDGTSLFWAILRGQERAALEMLVAHGADIEARRSDGRSAYQVAMQHGHHEATAYLAALGADTAATPFERFVEACGRGDLAAARQITAADPRLFATLSEQDRQAFLRIAQMGKAALLAAMIDSGFPVGSTGPHGQTALHWAAWHGWRDAAAELLSRGAAVDAVETEYGARPLGWAVHGSENWPNPEGDYPGVVLLLLTAGATVDGVEISGCPEPVADLLRAAGVKDSPDD
jgi:ankyrin repeat protein